MRKHKAIVQLSIPKSTIRLGASPSGVWTPCDLLLCGQRLPRISHASKANRTSLGSFSTPYHTTNSKQFLIKILRAGSPKKKPEIEWTYGMKATFWKLMPWTCTVAVYLQQRLSLMQQIFKESKGCRRECRTAETTAEEEELAWGQRRKRWDWRDGQSAGSAAIRSCFQRPTEEST